MEDTILEPILEPKNGIAAKQIGFKDPPCRFHFRNNFWVLKWSLRGFEATWEDVNFIFHFIYGMSSFPLTHIVQDVFFTTNQWNIRELSQACLMTPLVYHVLLSGSTWRQDTKAPVRFQNTNNARTILQHRGSATHAQRMTRNRLAESGLSRWHGEASPLR